MEFQSTPGTYAAVDPFKPSISFSIKKILGFQKAPRDDTDLDSPPPPRVAISTRRNGAIRPPADTAGSPRWQTALASSQPSTPQDCGDIQPQSRPSSPRNRERSPPQRRSRSSSNGSDAQPPMVVMPAAHSRTPSSIIALPLGTAVSPMWDTALASSQPPSPQDCGDIQSQSRSSSPSGRNRNRERSPFQRRSRSSSNGSNAQPPMVVMPAAHSRTPSSIFASHSPVLALIEPPQSPPLSPVVGDMEVRRSMSLEFHRSASNEHPPPQKHMSSSGSCRQGIVSLASAPLDEKQPVGLSAYSPESVHPMTYVAAFALDTVPRQIYLNFLLRLPYMYFSRVKRVFEEADMSMPQIKRGILEAAIRLTEPVKDVADAWKLEPVESVQYSRLQDTWQSFIDSLMKEWETLNIVSALLLT